MLHLERTQQGPWWKAHHSSSETWRWITDVWGMCELQRHREFGQNWWQDECSMLSEKYWRKICTHHAQMGRTWTFQHDDDPKHKAKSTCRWLQHWCVGFWVSLNKLWFPSINFLCPLLLFVMALHWPWHDAAQEFPGTGGFLPIRMGSFTTWENSASSTTSTKDFELSLMLKGEMHSFKN